MKKRNILLATFALALVLVASPRTQAQCDVQMYTQTCVQKLKQLGGFQFLKSYKVDGQKGSQKTIEYSYVFSRGTTYLITFANSDKEGNGIKFTLLDGQKRPITTNYDNTKKSFLPAVQLKCQRTGMYYLSYTFEGTTDYCAASVIGFKR